MNSSLLKRKNVTIIFPTKLMILLQFLLLITKINSQKQDYEVNLNIKNENFNENKVIDNFSNNYIFGIEEKTNTTEQDNNKSLKFLQNDFINGNKDSSINQNNRESEIRDFRYLQTNTTNNTNTTNTTASNITTIKPTTVFIKSKCLNDADCSSHGICDRNSSMCICNKDYITIYENKTATITKIEKMNITYYDYTGQKQCNYNQKKQLTAFMLSIFVGFGAEHFYMERNGIGVAKLVFYIFCGFLNILYLILYKCVPGGEKYVSFIHTYEALYLGCGVGYMLLWNIFDWVNIGFNDFLDGNNVPLAPWG